jgi:hypothetical protein
VFFVVFYIFQSILAELEFTFYNKDNVFFFNDIYTYRVSQKWRTNYLLPYRGCLNVHEKNIEKMFPIKKSINFIIFRIPPYYYY